MPASRSTEKQIIGMLKELTSAPHGISSATFCQFRAESGTDPRDFDAERGYVSAEPV